MPSASDTGPWLIPFVSINARVLLMKTDREVKLPAAASMALQKKCSVF